MMTGNGLRTLPWSLLVVILLVTCPLCLVQGESGRATGTLLDDPHLSSTDDLAAQGDLPELHDGSQLTRQLTAEELDVAGEKEADPVVRSPPIGRKKQQVVQQGKAGAKKGLGKTKQLPQKTAENTDDREKGIPIMLVTIMTIVMAVAAGLGALPFFFVKSLSAHYSALATAIACGFMFGASFDLIHEGQPYGGRLVVFGLVLGSIFIRFSQKQLERWPDAHLGSLKGHSARRMVLMIGIMAAHAFGEGCGVGVSFCGERGWAQGVLTTLAIGVHNVPEGLAKATVLVSQGASAQQALLWSIVTCLPQPLVAVPAFMFVETFQVLLPVALGFAAGCMIWLVFSELLPDAMAGAPSAEVATFATLSAASLEGMRMAFESLEGADGSMELPGHGELLWPALRMILLFGGAATAAGGAVGGTFLLPSPMAFGCFSSITGAAAVIIFVRQVFLASHIPLLHTLSGIALGAAGSLVMRRHMLMAVKKAAAMASRALGKVTEEAAHPQNDVEGAIAAAAAAEFGNGNGGTSDYDDPFSRFSNIAVAGQFYQYAGSSINNMQMRRQDRYDPYDGEGQMTTTLERAASTSKRPNRRFKAPVTAAMAVAFIGLAVQAVSTGLHAAGALATSKEPSPSASVLAILVLGAFRGAAGSLVLVAVFGPSASSGILAGCATVFVTGVSMIASLLQPIEDEGVGIDELYGYPFGLAETVDAVAIGSLAVASLMAMAVAMSTNPRHARFGALLGLVPALLVPLLLSSTCTLAAWCLPVS